MAKFTVKSDYQIRKENDSICMGDKWALESFDLYQTQKRKCYKYAGKSAINRRRWSFYENLLFPTDLKSWWMVDKSYVNNVLWFLRRIKIDTTKDEEFALLLKFAARLPLHRLWFGFGLHVNKNADLLAYFKKQRASATLLV